MDILKEKDRSRFEGYLDSLQVRGIKRSFLILALYPRVLADR